LIETSQVPVSEKTFSKLAILKSKGVVYKEGESVTWDNVVNSACEVCNKNEGDFLMAIKKENGKSRTTKKVAEELNEKISQGDMITSEKIESLVKSKRMRG
jgi:hypothetical protein